MQEKQNIYFFTNNTIVKKSHKNCQMLILNKTTLERVNYIKFLGVRKQNFEKYWYTL